MKEHFCPVENTVIAYQDKCNWCGELENQKPVVHNFCSICGKRIADLTHIHTCTPPQEKNA